MTGWDELDRFLRTDPRDVGCDQALRVLHVYVELVLDLFFAHGISLGEPSGSADIDAEEVQ
jgi:hypothetical protein